MKIEYTNYDGDWEENCPFCGKPQRDHQVNLGIFDGVTYIHRQPCKEEQYQITRKWYFQGLRNRIFIVTYDVIVYLWGLIPFKEMLKLIWGITKHCYKSIRGFIYLLKQKPK